MARIPMTSGFTLIPEGTYVFLIYDVKYDEEFGKLEIYLVNAQNMTHTERFSLIGNDGEPNEKALNAFSFFAKTALNRYDMEDVDPQELVGHYIEAEVTHTQSPSTKYPGRMNTFANLAGKFPAEGFSTQTVAGVFERLKKSQKAANVAGKPAPQPMDLDNLLGD